MCEKMDFRDHKSIKLSTRSNPRVQFQHPSTIYLNGTGGLGLPDTSAPMLWYYFSTSGKLYSHHISNQRNLGAIISKHLGKEQQQQK